jgi:hypothetical protein
MSLIILHWSILLLGVDIDFCIVYPPNVHIGVFAIKKIGTSITMHAERKIIPRARILATLFQHSSCMMYAWIGFHDLNLGVNLRITSCFGHTRVIRTIVLPQIHGISKVHFYQLHILTVISGLSGHGVYTYIAISLTVTLFIIIFNITENLVPKQQCSEILPKNL